MISQTKIIVLFCRNYSKLWEHLCFFPPNTFIWPHKFILFSQFSTRHVYYAPQSKSNNINFELVSKIFFCIWHLTSFRFEILIHLKLLEVRYIAKLICGGHFNYLFFPPFLVPFQVWVLSYEMCRYWEQWKLPEKTAIFVAKS